MLWRLINELRTIFKCSYLNILFWDVMTDILKKTLWPLFYRWGSSASRLEPLRGGSLLFNIKFLGMLILSTSERWKAELTLEPPILQNILVRWGAGNENIFLHLIFLKKNLYMWKSFLYKFSTCSFGRIFLTNLSFLAKWLYLGNCLV